MDLHFLFAAKHKPQFLVANFSFMNQNEQKAFGAAKAIFLLANKSKYKHADYLTAKCFKSALYLILSLPFGEELY